MLYILLFVILAACFLLGMTWMRVGLFNLSGSAMENWLRKVTGTPLKGMIAGIAMTAVLQSSSAVTVIAVGLVSARILSFPQTIGIILGTNIGTTITLEFFTFDLSKIIIPLLTIGVILQFFRRTKLKSWSFIFMGIGIIFAAMNGFEWLSSRLADIDYIQNLIYVMRGNASIAFLIGVFLTALIQSSTVMTGIAMSFLGAGIFPLETGIAIMLGANIGTCATALLAGIGAGREARLTAYAHMWLNIGGAVLFLPFIHFLAGVSSTLTSEPGTQLAHASVIYNLVCSLLVFPFANRFSHFISWMHGKEKQ
ncbi:Na/Pi symporter [Lederbergia citrea]|uniref:Na/Pi cotransporter family protein n=1 Tax=Lederbergia citrea TaxID=2833581 RepID=A0A942UKQ5_9BACI|nr:Na/Pi symporter [Lederbergia citrea]MBS4176287.1 Na/Pi cotransporter family protein [Lederbergia citrea]MBS4202848.1 Na/Pi cotransporter family protein [Lederbergia citrea]MBS4222485.1 Na/Pi cotransporter family protein [Lederbergia citrea]